MNKYVKEYLIRGLIFGGFGPIIAGIVFWILHLSKVELSLTGSSMFLTILSTYILAFVHAGSSVFNQIEEWSIAKSTGIHFLSLYIVYIVCYLVNSWLPFAWGVIAIFTGIFIVVYFVIWLTVYLILKHTSNNLNKAIE